jgi:hypothetical protein
VQLIGRIVHGQSVDPGVPQGRRDRGRGRRPALDRPATTAPTYRARLAPTRRRVPSTRRSRAQKATRTGSGWCRPTLSPRTGSCSAASLRRRPRWIYEALRSTVLRVPDSSTSPGSS